MLSRTAVAIQLAILCVGLNCLLPGDSHAQGRREARPAAGKAGMTKDNAPVWQKEVKGWGQNEEEAKQDALKKAQALVQSYLRRQDPPVLWQPTAEFVQGLGSWPMKRGDDAEQVVDIGEQKLKLKCWVLTVTITRADRDEIARRDTQYREEQERREREARVQQQREERAGRATERMGLLARVLGILVAALLATAAYIRLDDLTKGYYSRWLAAGAAGLALVALVAACLG